MAIQRRHTLRLLKSRWLDCVLGKFNIIVNIIVNGHQIAPALQSSVCASIPPLISYELSPCALHHAIVAPPALRMPSEARSLSRLEAPSGRLQEQATLDVIGIMEYTQTSASTAPLELAAIVARSILSW
jgi:hypothetical protein